MRILLFLSGLAAAAGLLSAQVISIGVKGGIPLNDGTSNTSIAHDESPSYIVGGSVEVRLPASFAIEADALYRRIGNTLSSSPLLGTLQSAPPFTITTAFTNRLRGDSWEFPLIGKFYFGEHSSGWQPFIGTGFAFRTVGFASATSQTTLDPTGNSATTSFRGNSRSDIDVGATIAGGIRLRRGRIAFTPEVRYTRWGSSENQLNRNDARILLGLSF